MLAITKAERYKHNKVLDISQQYMILSVCKKQENNAKIILNNEVNIYR